MIDATVMRVSILAIAAAATMAEAAPPADPLAGAPVRRLESIFVDLGNRGAATVNRVVKRATERGPSYVSMREEVVVFEGCFRPSKSTTLLTVLSDDGCKIEIDGQVVLDRFRVGQHLPNLSQSLHTVAAPTRKAVDDGPVGLVTPPTTKAAAVVTPTAGWDPV